MAAICVWQGVQSRDGISTLEWSGPNKCTGPILWNVAAICVQQGIQSGDGISNMLACLGWSGPQQMQMPHLVERGRHLHAG